MRQNGFRSAQDETLGAVTVGSNVTAQVFPIGVRRQRI